MFIRRLITPFLAFTPNEPGGGGGNEIDAALDAAGAQADAHIASETGGTPPPPASPPQQQQPPSQGQEPSRDDMTYRDATQLREELQKDRERWRPFEQAFGSFDPNVQEQILAAVPSLGEDLALITNTFASMHPEDRRFIAEISQMAQTDPMRAAELFAEAAGLVAGPDAGELDPEQFGAETPDAGEQQPPEYLTQDQLEEWWDAKQEEQAIEQGIDGIVAEAQQLGYDPFSTDDNDSADFQLLIAFAQRSPDGDLKAAHEKVEAYRQRGVDKFVEGKREDSRRPGPPDGGAPPSGERRLETLDDAESAMRSRIDAEHGPSQTPRRR